MMLEIQRKNAQIHANKLNFNILLFVLVIVVLMLPIDG